jgi:nicotinamide-nucleotide adenylyltransferase
MRTRTVGVVTGRFQPVHAQHVELFEMVIEECDRLIVAVTNPDTGARHEEPTSAHRHTAAANPFSYYERCLLLGAALEALGLGDQSVIVPFDLTRPQVWPDYVPLSSTHYVRVYGEWERQKAQWFTEAGYRVSVLDGDPEERVSSSDIRESLRQGRFHDAVADGTEGLLTEFLRARPLSER